ncbi:MAG: hypothetical protein DIU70_011905 [Bacillota bacterium]|nr:MAG: hypothetical protein DIU70_01900 [Bacillota bacterium]
MADLLERLLELHRRGIELPARLTLEDQRRILAGEWPPGPTAPRKRGNHKGVFPTEPFPWATPGRQLHLVLPGYLPPSLNEYSRRKSVRIRAVPEAVQHIRWALLEAKADGRPFWRPRLEIRLWFPVRRRRDRRTNWTKVLEDALVDAGLIVDDSEEWCETLPPETGVDPRNPRTEIILTERGPV